MFCKDSNTLCSFPNSLTKFYFLFGTNICHSPSPALHSGWFQEYGLNAVYLSAAMKAEPNFLSLLDKLLLIDGFSGGNITMPFKNEIVAQDRFHRSEEVQICRSANTIFCDDKGQWSLANTDIYGIEKTISYLFDTQQEFELVVLGGGGAASSAIHVGQTSDRCKRIFCLTRSPEKTIEKFNLKNRTDKLEIYSLCAASLASQAARCDLVHPQTAVLVINAIPPRQTGEETSLDSAYYFIDKLNRRKNIFYFDMVYADTLAILTAQKHKIKSVNGSLMLKEQARKAFWYWTDILPKS